MMRIDSHQHFWNYDPIEYDWIDDSMPQIKRSFLPEDLQPLLQRRGLHGCVAVQARQKNEENEFLLELAADNSIVKAVVGWTDLRADEAVLKKELERLASNKKFKGIRHIVQGEADGFMLDPAFQRGLKLLPQFGLSYDILIFERQLAETRQLLEAMPEDMPFVIDHAAKPDICNLSFLSWEKHIRAIAADFPLVSIKLSGMVTEANMSLWQMSDFASYFEVLIEAFGPQRLMYGSDWPVCLLAASYEQVYDLAAHYLGQLSTSEQDAVFGANAARFYKI